MKSELTNGPDEAYVEIHSSGSASVEGMLEISVKRGEHPTWAKSKRALMDLRKLDATGFNSKQVRMFTSDKKGSMRTLRGGRVAIVASDAATFGYARMWESLAADDLGIEVMVFYNIDEARAWLVGVNDP